MFLPYLSSHISTNYQKVVFRNVPDKGRLLFKDGSDVCFISCISETVP